VFESVPYGVDDEDRIRRHHAILKHATKIRLGANAIQALKGLIGVHSINLPRRKMNVLQWGQASLRFQCWLVVRA
jgi:hypothetical protein